MDKIKEKNNEKEFITAFVAKNGYPVWNRTLNETYKVKNTSFHFNGQDDSSNIYYIPLVPENGQVISGAIRAVVTDTISLTLMPANWYSILPYSNTLQEGTAGGYAIKMMQINQAVFGNKIYTVTDRKLFNFSNYDTTKTLLQVELIDSATGTTNNLVQSYCTWVRLSWQCEICYMMSCPLSGTNSVQVCYEYDDGNTGGGSSGGGGTGGGGNGIPYLYPCVPNPPVAIPFANNLMPEEPLPPCPPPAAGTGWVPVGGTGSRSTDFDSNAPSVDPDANWWDDITTDFPPQLLPSWSVMNNNYPKKPDGTEKCAEDVFNEVGGQVQAIGGSNACALRMSITLNKSGINIPSITNQTYMGADGKYYFLSAAKLYNFMLKTFKIPPNPAGSRVSLSGTQGGTDGVNFPTLLSGKKGIYLMRPNYPGNNYFGATGHASMFNGSSGVVNTCDLNHPSDGTYFNASGGVNNITVWILN